MTVPYLLRFCPFRALICMLFGIHTQGVASLALGYALVGLSAHPCLNQKLQFLFKTLNLLQESFELVFPTHSHCRR